MVNIRDSCCVPESVCEVSVLKLFSPYAAHELKHVQNNICDVAFHQLVCCGCLLKIIKDRLDFVCLVSNVGTYLVNNFSFQHFTQIKN
jgi:hypothetical protein